MGDDTDTAVAAAVAASDPWPALERLAQEAPTDLLPVVRRRYLAASSECRRRLSWLLRLVDGGDQLMLELLPGVTGADAADLLRELVGRCTPVAAEEIARLLPDPAARKAAVVAAGSSQLVALAPAVAGFLDTPRLRGPAAISLGRMRATAYTEAIASRLAGLDGLEHQAFVVALELMGDARAVPALLEHLARASWQRTFDIQHALILLTGYEPLIPLHRKPERWTSAVRDAWARRVPGHSSPPQIDHVKLPDQTRATVGVHNGLHQVGIRYDPPTPGSSWPRWDRSLSIAGKPVYHVGSHCDTCETTLRLLGWPEPEAADLAQRLRGALNHVPAITRDLIDTAHPLLSSLRTGHYQLTLVDLDLEAVTAETRSWWHRRVAVRKSCEPWQTAPNGEQWPGTDHFQLRTPLPHSVPTFASVLPTRPLDTLSRDIVDRYSEAIAGGHRPAAIMIGWAQHRWVEAEDEEQYLVGVILDGHHKTLAYVDHGLPARALLICRDEDSEGPDPWNHTAWLQGLTEPLRATAHA